MSAQLQARDRNVSGPEAAGVSERCRRAAPTFPDLQTKQPQLEKRTRIFLHITGFSGICFLTFALFHSELAAVCGQLGNIVLRLELRQGNNRVANPKQRRAFSSSFIRLLKHSFVNPSIMRACTRVNTHTHTHEKATLLPHKVHLGSIAS